MLFCEAAVDAAREGREFPREGLYVASRQAGKNEADARFCVRMLCKLARIGGQAIKSAPTYKPQISVSKRRLKAELDAIVPLRGEWSMEEGYRLRLLQACIAFLSAGPTANRVGETANNWLTIDECQDTNTEVFNKDFSPMRASTGAPVFYQGTAWTADCLLEATRQRLLQVQEDDPNRIQRVWEVPWDVRARYNEAYHDFCMAELERLGPRSLIWLSQYCLQSIAGSSRFLDPGQLEQLHGEHPRGYRLRGGERYYVAGVDFSGKLEAAGDEQMTIEQRMKLAEQRDSTCAVVGELTWRPQLQKDGTTRLTPQVRVVDCFFRQGHPDDTVVELMRFLFETWKVSWVVLDGVGVGDNPSATLERKRPGNVRVLKSTLTDITRMGYRMHAAIHSDRLKLWKPDSTTPDTPGYDEEWGEMMLQFQHLQKQVLPSKQMRFFAPTRQVGGKTLHDDGPKAMGYLVEAAYDHLTAIHPPPTRSTATGFTHWDIDQGYAA